VNANEYQKFKNRLLNLIIPYIKTFYLNSIDSEFCLIAGEKYNYKFDDPLAPSARLYQFKPIDSVIYAAFKNSENSISLIFLLQCVFFVLYNRQQYDLISKLFYGLKDILDLSPYIGVQASNLNNKVVLYPSGAKLLDKKLINQNLHWLMEYPEVLELFEKSLADYLNYSGENAEARTILDNLRASLETLIKNILQNDKTLENNAKEIKEWLKAKEMHPNIVNSVGIFSHFNNYIHFMNDVKHNKPNIHYSKNEIEHVIYQTGIFIRLIIEAANDSS